MKGDIHYDEKYIQVGDDWNFDLNAVDSITKFVLAHKFTDERTKEVCIEFLTEIKDNCYPQILERYLSEKHKKVKDRKLFEFVCDGFENYKSAFNKLFRRTANLTFGVPIANERSQSQQAVGYQRNSNRVKCRSKLRGINPERE